MPIGKIEPFNLSSKQWPAYIRRVQQFILLNEIKDELQVPMLITVVGEATYALMCDLCSPELPESKKFDELVTLVTDHLEPQRSEIAERHVFRLRRQLPGESLSEYLQNLKHLASTCNFGLNLEENLRDQFVSGLGSEMMRSRIFAEKSIKYKAAVELALALEAAEKHAIVSAVTASSRNGGGGVSSLGGEGETGEGLHQASARRPAAREGGGGGGGAGGLARAGGGGGRAGGGDEAATSSQCWRCGKPHRPNKCRYAQYSCDACHQRGHLRVMCDKVRFVNNKASTGRHNFLSVQEEYDESDGGIYQISVAAKGNKPYFITLKMDNELIDCEIDTGSRISAISEDLYKRVFQHKTINFDTLLLKCYNGSQIRSLGYILVNVTLGDVIVHNLSLYVIKDGGRPLLGREWMTQLKINQINFHDIIDLGGLVNQLCTEFPDVFTDKLGTCKQDIKLQLIDKEPVYVRARPVPLALKHKVELELQRLEREGNIYRVDHSEYGTPIVPVVKENGDIRICGDYKITINPKLKRDFYPLPRIEELFSVLSGGDMYSKIDLKHAFAQCFLNSESRACTAITTHMGTFVYKRTPYGLSVVPEKFQKLMEETLRGVPHAAVFADDICVTGSNDEDHLRNLKSVLQRLRDMGLTVKLEKCKFLQREVKYLGYIIDKQGLRPDPAKIDAISNAPTPKDVTQLKSWLGMLNYYGRFIVNLSSILHPLHKLLKKEVPWKWDAECERAFDAARRYLTSDRVLAHYEAERPLVLSVDSSSYGLGAVLAHRYEDGSERPVSCVSRTLNDAERKYSQLDKEALAIYFGITKHHQYLFGRQFVLRSDHKPLSYIFGEKRGIPQTAASRLQRWAVRLLGYDFKIEFVKSLDNGPADALSRLPLPHGGVVHQIKEPVMYVNLLMETLPVNFKQIAQAISSDKILNKIYGYILYGWPAEACCEDEKPYFARKDELIVDLGCIIYRYRIVVPPVLRERVLDEIHEGHLGMNKMKSLSRGYVYWPSIDRDIEELCRACTACRSVLDAPPRAVLHPWEFPELPWQRLHADFADFAGKRYLIIIDAHSKWIEAIQMKGSDATATTNALRSVFARFGLPSQLVTDNGPPFSSYDFNDYCLKNCIRHITSAPYRPQANGAAENAVKTIKKNLKRAVFLGEDLSAALSKFLFQYRNCEHASTGVSPAQALLGRRLRGRLDALRPSRAAAVREAQARQVAAAPGTRRQPFRVGDTVLARDYSAGGEKWSEGVITQQTGPISYKVGLNDGKEWRRHQDQIVSTNNGKSGRLSLSRASIVSAPPDAAVDDDEAFEDASGEATVEVADGSRISKSFVTEVTPGTATTQPQSSPECEGPGVTPVSPQVSPPPAGASSRAWRAYNRAKKQLM